MIWLLLAIGAFATGAATRPGWTIVVWPLVSVGLGVYVVANEAPSYDMHGSGYYLGGFTAAACTATWLAGRSLRRRLLKR